MIRTKLGLLGLCAVVFGMMALSTTAQAEVGSEWLFAQKAPGTALINFLEAELGLAKDSATLVLHAKIVGIEALFLCTDIAAVGAVLKAGGSIGNGAKVLFSNCTTDLNKKLAPECEPNDKVDGKGKIVTNPGHALLVLGASKEHLVKVLPDSGNIFATIEMSATCPLGTKIPVVGTLFLKDCKNPLEHLVEHLVEEGPGTKLFVISEKVGNEATLTGSAFAKLLGLHAGIKFSGKWA